MKIYNVLVEYSHFEEQIGANSPMSIFCDEYL